MTDRSYPTSENRHSNPGEELKKISMTKQSRERKKKKKVGKMGKRKTKSGALTRSGVQTSQRVSPLNDGPRRQKERKHGGGGGRGCRAAESRLPKQLILNFLSVGANDAPTNIITGFNGDVC